MLEQIAEDGLETLPDLMRIVINTAMQAERANHSPNLCSNLPGGGYGARRVVGLELWRP